jgi:hypothetical protein
VAARCRSSQLSKVTELYTLVTPATGRQAPSPDSTVVSSARSVGLHTPHTAATQSFITNLDFVTLTADELQTARPAGRSLAHNGERVATHTPQQ